MEQELPTYVGPLEPFEFTVNDEVQGQYLEALEDDHLRYVLSHQGVPPVVHPGILLSHSNATRSPSFGGPNTGWIAVREQTHFTASARLHERLVVRWRIEEHEPWFGRVLSRVSCVITRCGGQVILERIMWGFRTTSRRPIPAGSGTGPPDPVSLPAGAREDAPTTLEPGNREISGRPKWVTVRRVRLFSGWTAQNLHTSEQIAKDAGLPAPVASAAQGMGYLCEFMIDNLGEDWMTGGSWVLNFRKPIFPGDLVSPLGQLRSVEPTDRGAQCTLGIQLVNQHGRSVTQGTATGHLQLA